LKPSPTGIQAMQTKLGKVTLLFLLIGIGLFFNARNNPFHYDDHHSIQYNPHIRSLLNIPHFFSNPHTFSSQRTGFMFRPVLLISYALNYAWGGQEVQGYRWVNLVIHVGCTVLLYLLAVCLTGKEDLATGIGLVFLVHPAHGELINYISSRSDLLVSLFYLGGCWLVAQGTTRGRWWSLVAYGGGVLTKSVAITFPAMAFFLSKDRGEKLRVRSSLLFSLALGVISVVYLTIIWSNRFLASSAAKAPRTIDVQIWSQIKAFVYYLWLFVIPTQLNVEHQFETSLTLWDPTTLLAGLFLVSLGAGIISIGNRLLRVGGIWFVLTLLPASLVPLNILVSERRVYLASAGLIIIGVWAWWGLFQRRAVLGKVIGVVACLVFAGMCIQRNQVWSSEIELWEDAVQKAPGMYRARLNLGIEYEKAERLEDALQELRVGLELKPDNADAWVIMGNIDKERGEGEQAEAAYLRALEIDPDLEGVYHNLGNLYLIDRGENEKAIAFYEECLRRNEYFVKARPNLGQAYEGMGRLGDALEQYERGVADSLFWEDSKDPELGGTWFNLARLSAQLGDFERAAVGYEKAYALLKGKSQPLYQSFAEQAFLSLRELEERER